MSTESEQLVNGATDKLLTGG